MQQRKQFLHDWETDARYGRVNLAALCRAYGISRPTAYKWINRYLEACQTVSGPPVSHVLGLRASRGLSAMSLVSRPA